MFMVSDGLGNSLSISGGSRPGPLSALTNVVGNTLTVIRKNLFPTPNVTNGGAYSGGRGPYKKTQHRARQILKGFASADERRKALLQKQRDERVRQAGAANSVLRTRQQQENKYEDLGEALRAPGKAKCAREQLLIAHAHHIIAVSAALYRA
jgi:hypothetical protein